VQDKNSNNREAAEKKFKEVSEAYEVCGNIIGVHVAIYTTISREETTVI
jgi:hypothetical protein